MFGHPSTEHKNVDVRRCVFQKRAFGSMLRKSTKLHEYSTTNRILQAFALVLSVVRIDVVVAVAKVVVLVSIDADDGPKVIS